MGNFKIRSMRHGVVRIASFCLIGVLLIAGMFMLSAVSAFSGFFAAATVADSALATGYFDICPVIEKVRSQDDSTKLIVGDSVCQQVFNDLQERNSEYCVAGTYCTVGIPGQYNLVYEYLNAHPDATDVYLMIRPQSLDAQFDSNRAYMYAVAPFVTMDAAHWDNETCKQLKETYWWYGINAFVTQFIVNSPMLSKLYLSQLDIRHHVDTYAPSGFSEESKKYLLKLQQLCDERRVSLHLIPLPITDEASSYAVVENLLQIAEGTDLEDLLKEFSERVIYCPAEYFSDGQHFEFQNVSKQTIIQMIQEKNQLLLDFND